MPSFDQQVSSRARDAVSVAARSMPAAAASAPCAAVSEPSRLGVKSKAGTTTPICDTERFFAERFADASRAPLADAGTNGASSPASATTTGATAAVDAATRLRALLERAAADARASDARIEILSRERDAGASSGTEGSEGLAARLRDAEAELATCAKTQSETARDLALLRACVASLETRARRVDEKRAAERAATAATAAALDDARAELASTRARLDKAVKDAAQTKTETKRCIDTDERDARRATPSDAESESTNASLVASARAEAAEAAAELASSRALHEAAREELEALHDALRETSEAGDARAARILELEAANAQVRKLTAKIAQLLNEDGRKEAARARKFKQLTFMLGQRLLRARGIVLAATAPGVGPLLLVLPSKLPAPAPALPPPLLDKFWLSSSVATMSARLYTSPFRSVAALAITAASFSTAPPPLHSSPPVSGSLLPSANRFSTFATPAFASENVRLVLTKRSYVSTIPPTRASNSRTRARNGAPSSSSFGPLPARGS